MPRRKHEVPWRDAALVLYLSNPDKYTPSALARLFHVNSGDVWYAVHPGWRKDYDAARYQDGITRARKHDQDKAYYQKVKDDPHYKSRRAAASKRWRERQKGDTPLQVNQFHYIKQ